MLFNFTWEHACLRDQSFQRTINRQRKGLGALSPCASGGGAGNNEPSAVK